MLIVICFKFFFCIVVVSIIQNNLTNSEVKSSQTQKREVLKLGSENSKKLSISFQENKIAVSACLTRVINETDVFVESKEEEIAVFLIE